jgi:BASS family bile acid:Na+ symporter
MTAQFEVVVPLLVVGIMVIVGTDIRFEDFRRMRRYPILVPCIVFGQWVLLTLAAGLAGRALDLPPEIVGGVLLVAAAPVAGMSVYYTQLAGGHLALAVTIAAVSNVLAVAMTPIVASIGFRWFLQANAETALPILKVAQQTTLGFLLPLLVGMLIRFRAPAWVERWRGPLQGLGMAAIVAILGMVVVDQFVAIRAQLGILLGAAALFTLVMLAAGLFVTILLARDGGDRRAVVWGFPARNVALATLIATSAIGKVAIASFIAVLFATQIIVLVPLALWLRYRGGKQYSAAPTNGAA